MSTTETLIVDPRPATLCPVHPEGCAIWDAINEDDR